MGDHLNYPKGRIAIDGGDLVDVYDISLTVADGRQLVSTLRQNPAGSTGGKVAATLTFKTAISENGLERPYWKDWAKKTVKQARLKVPGATLIVEGVLTNPSLTSNVDSFTDNTWTIIGSIEVT